MPVFLEVDCGNSLAKWRVLTGESIGLRGVLNYSESFESVFRHLKGGDSLEGCRVVSVAPANVNARLVSAWKSYSSKPILFSKVEPFVEGIQCGYSDVTQLGVDRWSAILAASKLTSESCLVVDAGTAATLDLLSSGGVHHGGYILPGVDLMLSSLRDGTAIPKLRIPLLNDLGETVPGEETRAAIGNAIGLMWQSTIRDLLSGLGEDAKVFVTGGQAELVSRYIEGAICEPDLVMDGLKWSLPESKFDCAVMS